MFLCLFLFRLFFCCCQFVVMFLVSFFVGHKLRRVCYQICLMNRPWIEYVILVRNSGGFCSWCSWYSYAFNCAEMTILLCGVCVEWLKSLWLTEAQSVFVTRTFKLLQSYNSDDSFVESKYETLSESDSKSLDEESEDSLFLLLTHPYLGFKLIF